MWCCGGDRTGTGKEERENKWDVVALDATAPLQSVLYSPSVLFGDGWHPSGRWTEGMDGWMDARYRWGGEGFGGTR